MSPALSSRIAHPDNPPQCQRRQRLGGDGGSPCPDVFPIRYTIPLHLSHSLTCQVLTWVDSLRCSLLHRSRDSPTCVTLHSAYSRQGSLQPGVHQALHLVILFPRNGWITEACLALSLGIHTSHSGIGGLQRIGHWDLHRDPSPLYLHTEGLMIAPPSLTEIFKSFSLPPG